MLREPLLNVTTNDLDVVTDDPMVESKFTHDLREIKRLDSSNRLNRLIDLYTEAARQSSSILFSDTDIAIVDSKINNSSRPKYLLLRKYLNAILAQSQEYKEYHEITSIAQRHKEIIDSCLLNDSSAVLSPRAILVCKLAVSILFLTSFYLALETPNVSGNAKIGCVAGASGGALFTFICCFCVFANHLRVSQNEQQEQALLDIEPIPQSTPALSSLHMRSPVSLIGSINSSPTNDTKQTLPRPPGSRTPGG